MQHGSLRAFYLSSSGISLTTRHIPCIPAATDSLYHSFILQFFQAAVCSGALQMEQAFKLCAGDAVVSLEIICEEWHELGGRGCYRHSCGWSPLKVRIAYGFHKLGSWLEVHSTHCYALHSPVAVRMYLCISANGQLEGTQHRYCYSFAFSKKVCHHFCQVT